MQLKGRDACCVHGVIYINPSSPLYQHGDALQLATLLHHEQFHALNPLATETSARNASLRFCERHGVAKEHFV